MKRPIKIVLAVFLIAFLYILWVGIGAALFGWTHGGGAIPIMLFLALAAFLWKTITKETPKEKKGNNDPKIEAPNK
jgi:membrane protein implicated in regulation of membrane protease activity